MARLGAMRRFRMGSVALVGGTARLCSMGRRFLWASVSPTTFTWRRAQPLHFSAKALYLSRRVAQISGQFRR